MNTSTSAHCDAQPVGLKDMTPEQLARAEWRFLYNTLLKAQTELQAGGVRMSWMDPAVQIAKERAAPPTGRGNKSEAVELDVTACYFPGTGDAELSWKRLSDGKSFAMTVKVTEKQGKALSDVVYPCVFWRATASATESDTARLDWLLPIVTGVDSPETDRRTTALGLAVMLGQDGRTAIDTARASAPAA